MQQQHISYSTHAAQNIPAMSQHSRYTAETLQYCWSVLCCM